MFSSDILCLQETHGTTEEVQHALRPAVRAGVSHVASAEAAAGGLVVFVFAVVMAWATCSRMILVLGRVMCGVLADTDAPHRSCHVHNFAIAQTDARRVRRKVHQDVQRSQVSPQRVRIAITGDFNIEPDARGRRSRDELAGDHARHSGSRPRALLAACPGGDRKPWAAWRGSHLRMMF